ncbi:MAG: mannonate dehydratase [Litorilinea sp.]
MSKPELPPNPKIAAQMSPEASPEEMQWVKQMGVDYVVLWTDESKSSADYYASRRKLFADHGLTVYGFGNRDVHNQDAIVLGLENRDAKIEQYKQHIRDLGNAGIPYTTYAHMANGIWSTERETTRGGASARGFDMAKADKGHWAGNYYPMPLTHGREYTQEEIWDNFAHFIQEVAPVAEDADVKIGIHPDDPPQPELGGVPRCIFSSYDGYARALEIADSPNVGLCLCVGCWLEGGPLMGKGVLETIKDFGDKNRIFKVHFRNVDAPLPHFVETFVDNGYQDMYLVMKALRETNFDGVVIPDHVPTMSNDPRLGTAYTLGYMNALLKRANDEAGVA